MITEQQIVKALGVPLSRVEMCWPLIDVALQALCGEIYSDRVRLAALATIRVECPPFAPIREYGTVERFKELYWDNEHVRDMLGNLTPDDAARYCGRGLIQLTGRSNYRLFGGYIGVNLLDNPDQALQLDTACALFAAYFHIHHKCTDAATVMDWIGVRRAVNGGLNGIKPFLLYVEMLAGAAGLQYEQNAAKAQYEQIKTAATMSAGA